MYYDNNRTIILNTQLLSIKIDSNCLFAITYDYNRTIIIVRFLLIHN